MAFPMGKQDCVTEDIFTYSIRASFRNATCTQKPKEHTIDLQKISKKKVVYFFQVKDEIRVESSKELQQMNT